MLVSAREPLPVTVWLETECRSEAGTRRDTSEWIPQGLAGLIRGPVGPPSMVLGRTGAGVVMDLRDARWCECALQEMGRGLSHTWCSTLDAHTNDACGV